MQKGYNVDLIVLEKGVDFNISEKLNYFRVSSLKARANKLVKLIYSPYQLLKLRKILRKLRPDKNVPGDSCISSIARKLLLTYDIPFPFLPS